MSAYYHLNFRSDVCILEIHQENNFFRLYCDGKKFGLYNSPKEAHFAVRLQETGYDYWDKPKQDCAIPIEFSDWTILQE